MSGTDDPLGESPRPSEFFSLKYRDDDNVVKTYNLRQEFSSRWRDLGKMFGFGEGLLRHFDKKGNGDTEVCMDEVLTEWTRNYSKPPEAYPVTWRGLLNALEHIGRLDREVDILQNVLKRRVKSNDSNRKQPIESPAASGNVKAYVMAAGLLLLGILISMFLMRASSGTRSSAPAAITTTYMTVATPIPSLEVNNEDPPPPPPSESDDNSPISLTSKPRMRELLSFHTYRGSVLNFPEEIGTDYDDFGVFLLNDDSGSVVANIISAHRGDPEMVNKELLKKWLGGRGRSPITWATLVEVLRLIQKNELANDIEKSMP